VNTCDLDNQLFVGSFVRIETQLSRYTCSAKGNLNASVECRLEKLDTARSEMHI
jgi:hypothetical protein